MSANEKNNWDYISPENFAIRTGIGLKQFVILICCGSFREFNPNKKGLLWEAHLLLNGRSGTSSSPALFETDSKKIVLPELETSVLEDLYDEIELRRKIREVNKKENLPAIGRFSLW